MFKNLEDRNQKQFHHEKGVTYFSRRMERTICFIMTVGMLLWGVAEGIVSLGG